MREELRTKKKKVENEQNKEVKRDNKKKRTNEERKESGERN